MESSKSQEINEWYVAGRNWNLRPGAVRSIPVTIRINHFVKSIVTPAR
jgi:hypothetical protein